MFIALASLPRELSLGSWDKRKHQHLLGVPYGIVQCGAFPDEYCYGKKQFPNRLLPSLSTGTDGQMCLAQTWSTFCLPPDLLPFSPCLASL